MSNSDTNNYHKRLLRDCENLADGSFAALIAIAILLCRDLVSVLAVTFLPPLVMNIINQASVYIKADNKHDLVITVNITIMMVLASCSSTSCILSMSSLSLSSFRLGVPFSQCFDLLMYLIVNVELFVENRNARSRWNQGKGSFCSEGESFFI